MKSVRAKDVISVTVLQNAITRKAAWATIKNAQTGEVLHTGKPGYIKRVAKQKYNKQVVF